MWEEAHPDGDSKIIADGCSNAVASEAAPTSLATDDIDIARRMVNQPVNLQQVSSAMGRGPNQTDDIESGRRLEDDAQGVQRQQDQRRVNDYRVNRGDERKTSDDPRHMDHRGSRRDYLEG